MTLRRIYAPQTPGERIVLESLLISESIPYVVDTGGFGSVYPGGLSVDGYTAHWIMVPDAWATDAIEVIANAEAAASAPAVASSPSWRHKLRMLVEVLIFGWFVPSLGPVHEKESSDEERQEAGH